MYRLIRISFLAAAMLTCQNVRADETTPYRNNRCMWASINCKKESIYKEDETALKKILVSWRLMPDDDYETAFDLYRIPDGKTRTLISGADGIIASTCFQDKYSDFSSDITYELCRHGATEVLASYTIKAGQLQSGVPYVSLPLQNWEGTPEGYIYKVNDCSYGDLDGDGWPEIIVKRGIRPDSLLLLNGGLAEEEHPEVRHSTMWEAYRLDGELMWRVLSGPNIQSGNQTSFAVYDLDGDGRCEVATRLSEGAVFGDGAEIGDTDGDGKTDYRDFNDNRNHTHGMPEFLCVIDGLSGKELARAQYIPTGDDSELWGDDYWKRAESIRIGLMKCDGESHSVIISRGAYAKTVIEAWDYSEGTLTRRWHFDSDVPGCTKYAGQGYHSLFVGDVDDDGLDELCYGSMTLDHDGEPLYVSGTDKGTETVLKGRSFNSTFAGYGHGDALHMGDFVPERPGLEIWSCFETGDYGAALRDARTGETIWYHKEAADVGRCSVADIFSEYPGCEMWWYGGNIMTADGETVTTDSGEPVAPPANNMAVWFTGSLNRQLLDGNKVCTRQRSDGKEIRALRANFFNAKAINGTKNNPCLYADLFGDWREEIIYVDSAETELKIFSTWYPTEYRFRPLLEDHHYEMSALNENIGYNQPTETGFYLGSNLLVSVTFVEENGLKPTVVVYRDSLMKSKIENGQLLAGRTYYFRATNYMGGYYKYSGSFITGENGQEVRFNIIDGSSSGIDAKSMPTNVPLDDVYTLSGVKTQADNIRGIVVTRGKVIRLK